MSSNFSLGRGLVGVITVTFNSGSVIDPFLWSTLQQSLANFRLVVVDNASSDNTLAQVEAFKDPRITIIRNATNSGYASANNQGIDYLAKQGAEWFLLVNNDVEFPASLFASLVDAAVTNQSRIVVPRVTFFDRPDVNWYGGGHFSWLRGIQGRHEPGRASHQPSYVSYAPMCCMLIHRTVFQQVGVLDDAYFCYWEDADFCWRLRKAGLPVLYIPDLSLGHKVSTLTGGPSAPFTAYQYSRSQVYFLRKHFGRVVVTANVALIRVKNRLRRLLNFDDAKTAQIRRQAIKDGLSAPVR